MFQPQAALHTPAPAGVELVVKVLHTPAAAGVEVVVEVLHTPAPPGAEVVVEVVVVNSTVSIMTP